MRTRLLLLPLVVLLLIGNIRAEDEDEDEDEGNIRAEDQDEDEDDDDDEEPPTTPRCTTTSYPNETHSIPAAATPSTANTECGLQFNGPSRLIVGGHNAEPVEWPWMVALLNRHDSKLFCGGVLITKRHVLTAAHCFEGTNYNFIRDYQAVMAVLGEYNLKRNDGNEQNFSISNIQIHREYSYCRTNFFGYDSYYRNDLAILTLDKSATFNKAIRPVCLPPHYMQDFNGMNATAIGWGDTIGDVNITIWADILQEVELPIVDQEECNNRHTREIIPEKEICAAHLDGGRARDTCNLDSGGPLLIQDQVNGPWTVIGIVSWGPKHCGKGVPGVYTRVDTFIDWIWNQLR